MDFFPMKSSQFSSGLVIITSQIFAFRKNHNKIVNFKLFSSKYFTTLHLLLKILLNSELYYLLY